MSTTNPVRSLRASIAANSRWASEADRLGATATARTAAATALARALIERHNIDLDAPDFEVRLEAARRAHFQRLALASVQSRQRKAARGRASLRALLTSDEAVQS